MEITLEPATIKLVKLLCRLDRMVFPQDPIPGIRLATRCEDKFKGLVAYCPGYLGEKEHYVVFKTLDSVVWNIGEIRRHLYLKQVLNSKNWEELPPFTLDEFLVGIAAHDIRHRVQRKFEISLFSPMYVEYLKNGQKPKNPNLVSVISFVALALSKQKFSDEIEFIEEFDAEVIEHISAQKIHEGLQLEEVANLIKKDAKRIWEEDSHIFSYLPLLNRYIEALKNQRIVGI